MALTPGLGNISQLNYDLFDLISSTSSVPTINFVDGKHQPIFRATAYGSLKIIEEAIDEEDGYAWAFFPSYLAAGSKWLSLNCKFVIGTILKLSSKVID